MMDDITEEMILIERIINFLHTMEEDFMAGVLPYDEYHNWMVQLYDMVQKYINITE